MSNTKIIKQVKEYLSKTKDNYDLRSTKRRIDRLFRLEEEQRNKAKTKIYKVGDTVQFYTPINYGGAHILKGTVEKIAYKKIKIKTDDGTFNVHAIKVGKPMQEKRQ